MVNPKPNLISETGNGIFLSRLSIITEILQGYDGTIPFHRYLKTFFTSRKNFGSTDRRLYSAFCFGFFRLGRALKELDFNKRLALSAFLTQEQESPFLKFLLDEQLGDSWINHLTESTAEKFTRIKNTFDSFDITDLAPAGGTLSSGISVASVAAHVVRQPLVWIRMRSEMKQQVIATFTAAGMIPALKDESIGAYGFLAASRLTDLERYKQGAFEIQDHASQVAGAMIPVKSNESWWDCCCGAGGKSLQLLDREPSLKLTASDLRDSILQNFKLRLKRNRLRTERIFQLDLSEQLPDSLSKLRFDGIMADVPCSGSGTWGRTPEQLSLFDPATLIGFYERQLGILHKVAPQVKQGGYLVYLTCSIYRIENEDVVNKFLESQPFSAETITMVNSMDRYGDCIFVAVMRRS